MKVKKYVAGTMADAMKMIRSELGDEALILNSKVVHSNGFFGLFKKKNFEIIAAVDPKPLYKQKTTTKESKSKVVFEPITRVNENEKPKIKVDNVETNLNSEELLKEISQLKVMMANIKNQDEGISLLPEPLSYYREILLHQEVSPKVTEQVMGKLLEKWFLSGSLATKDQVKEWLMNELTTLLSKKRFGGISFQKKFINVVGPTGVGKTTTLAKIAAECVLVYQKKVAFITTDTYRIAAIDQLKTYAKILNIPIEVCYNLNDFEMATEKFKNFDVVLIDTAGRNFRNKQYVEELKKVIDFGQDLETFLVLALTSKEKDMEDIFKQFSIISIDQFIFTKADETSIYGSMINMINKHDKGVAYITNGQDVPDDMIIATPEFVANILIGDK